RRSSDLGGHDRAGRSDRGVCGCLAAGGDAELRPDARRRGRGRPRLRRAAVRQRGRGSGGRDPAGGHRHPEGGRARRRDRRGDLRADVPDRRHHHALRGGADRPGDRRHREPRRDGDRAGAGAAARPGGPARTRGGRLLDDRQGHAHRQRDHARLARCGARRQRRGRRRRHRAGGRGAAHRGPDRIAGSARAHRLNEDAPAAVSLIGGQPRRRSVQSAASPAGCQSRRRRWCQTSPAPPISVSPARAAGTVTFVPVAASSSPSSSDAPLSSEAPSSPEALPSSESSASTSAGDRPASPSETPCANREVISTASAAASSCSWVCSGVVAGSLSVVESGSSVAEEPGLCEGGFGFSPADGAGVSSSTSGSAPSSWSESSPLESPAPELPEPASSPDPLPSVPLSILAPLPSSAPPSPSALPSSASPPPVLLLPVALSEPSSPPVPPSEPSFPPVPSSLPVSSSPPVSSPPVPLSPPVPSSPPGSSSPPVSSSPPPSPGLGSSSGGSVGSSVGGPVGSSEEDTVNVAVAVSPPISMTAWYSPASVGLNEAWTDRPPSVT